MGGYEAVTTFESFEHFVNPVDEIESLLKISKNIIFSTELLPNPISKPDQWSYYALDHGQHISFYSIKTLNFIAKKYNLHYFHYEGLHILTENAIPKWKFFILKNFKFIIKRMCKKLLRRKTSSDYMHILELNKNSIF